jgi:hypothetical protein
MVSRINSNYLLKIRYYFSLRPLIFTSKIGLKSLTSQRIASVTNGFGATAVR